MGKRFGFGGVILGGAIGAILGVLYAPRAGEETRVLLSEKADDYLNQGKQLYEGGFEKVQSRAGEVAEQVQERYEEVAGKVGSAGSRIMPQAGSSSDELRSKIDGARARIAAQIQKNSDEAGDRLRETAPNATSTFDSLDTEDGRYAHWNPAEEWMNAQKEENA